MGKADEETFDLGLEDNLDLGPDSQAEPALDQNDEMPDSSGGPSRRIYGSAQNIARFGLPSEHADAPIAYYFYPTWRSQLTNLCLLLISSVLGIAGSHWRFLEWTVIEGKLFQIGSMVYYLHLPLLIFAPGIVLGKILFFMYNSRYIIDDGAVEAQVGLVSWYLKQPRLRFEDIRGVEPEQSLVERILGIGKVLIGSAMTADVEIVMEGVSNPRAIQLLINKERDRRIKNIVQGSSGANVARALVVTGD